MSNEDITSQNSVAFDTIYSMTEKTQFPAFMFMFTQVVQKH